MFSDDNDETAAWHWHFCEGTGNHGSPVSGVMRFPPSDTQ